MITGDSGVVVRGFKVVNSDHQLICEELVRFTTFRHVLHSLRRKLPMDIGNATSLTLVAPIREVNYNHSF